jgi:hypothetical protein
MVDVAAKARKLMRWSAPARAWSESDFELPRIDPRADLALQRWCVVAGGLALVLSRLGEPERRSRFAATHALYELLRRDLQRSRHVSVGADLLGEVMHEIAETADGHTRQCLKACFQASLRQPATATAANEPEPATRTSALVSQPRPSGHAK